MSADRPDAVTPDAVAPAPTVPAPTVPAALSRAPVADVALVATFAAFLVVCTVLLALPVPGGSVPVTLQTFAVMLAGVLLGPRRGALAVLLYLVVGFAGLPVFAQGRGGLAVLGAASAGYLLAFVPGAAAAGWLTRLRRVPRTWLPAVVLGATTAATVLVVYPIGIAVMAARTGLSAGEAIVAGAAFLPFDVVKNVLVAIVAAAVFRAFPDMLERR
ncbi:MAG: biotin transporter BioY [Actinomycetales bacterium]|jgi:biotin transport system substrate-specific component|nr:biotin transporter BioY [Actinomycetales bacterium]